MLTKIQPKSKDFVLNQNGWFLMILATFHQKFLQNAKFGPVKLKELCVFLACFFVCLFVCLFCFVVVVVVVVFFIFPLFFFSFFLFFKLFFLLVALIYICAYVPPYYTISVSKIRNFQLLRGYIPLRHPQEADPRFVFKEGRPN